MHHPPKHVRTWSIQQTRLSFVAPFAERSAIHLRNTQRMRMSMKARCGSSARNVTRSSLRRKTLEIIWTLHIPTTTNSSLARLASNDSKTATRLSCIIAPILERNHSSARSASVASPCRRTFKSIWTRIRLRNPSSAKHVTNLSRLSAHSNFITFAIISQKLKWSVIFATKASSINLTWRCTCFITQVKRTTRAKSATANTTSLHILSGTSRMFMWVSLSLLIR